jgi:excisionase family DNA binding protein
VKAQAAKAQRRAPGTSYQPDDLLTIEEVCGYLRLSRDTLERHCADIPWVRLGESRRILFRELVRYLERRAA